MLDRKSGNVPPSEQIPSIPHAAEPQSAGPGQTTLRGCREYGGTLIALVYQSGVVAADVPYLLGKHGSSSDQAGSKLGEINDTSKLVALLAKHLSEKLISGPEPVVRLGNIRTGVRTGSDGLAAIVSVAGLEPGKAPEENRDYDCVCRDVDGKEFKGRLRYETTRPASPDGRFPAIKQNVVYGSHAAPGTDKLNLIAERLDLNAPDAEWVKPAALRAVLEEHNAADLPVWGVSTVFPGSYAPASNEPLSSKVDPLAEMTGNQFWAGHALMRTEPGFVDPKSLPPHAERTAILLALAEERFPGEAFHDLRSQIERSLSAPQWGPYHQEGVFMEAHLYVMLKNIENAAAGIFPDSVPEWAREKIRRLVLERREDIERYLLLHDIAKPDCLTVSGPGGEKPVTWQEWRQRLAADADYGTRALEGDEEAFGAFCRKAEIEGIAYYQRSTEEKRAHGAEGARMLREAGLGISEDILAAIEHHEAAYQFGKVLVPTYDQYFGRQSEEAQDFILAGSYLDTMATCRADGRPDLTNFLCFSGSRETLQTLKSVLGMLAGESLRQGIEPALEALHREGSQDLLNGLIKDIARESKLEAGELLKRIHTLRNSETVTPPGDAEKIAAEIRHGARGVSYNVDGLRRDEQLQTLVGIKISAQDRDALLELAESSPADIPVRFKDWMRVLGPILKKYKQ